ncbi:MAG: acetate--CoA ligase, partial [Pseudomonadales bacterium]|nr:acetate--CoA ligase [Pseudomonadales bacterium]
MSKVVIHPVSKAAASRSHLNPQRFEELYRQSIESPEEFWAEQAGELIYWHEPWKTVIDSDFTKAEAKWFSGARLNVAFNCIDRHLERRGEQTAIIWEGDEPSDDKKITYRELHQHVCRLSNALKQRGVEKGDRVCIYMPMIPEAAYAMLACARIGAIHSVVFGGFSPESLKDRILDSDCQTIITADQGVRGGRIIPLKANVDKALDQCPNVHSVFVVRRTNAEVPWFDERDVCYHKATAAANEFCEPELMEAEDPLFILYTSGSTGKPKGVLHTTAGYLVGASITHKYVFDYHNGDVYWCTADVGWVTGHSYIVYGPLANGAITLMFEGVPTYPDTSRFWQVVDKHQVKIFYTAPTAIRALMREGDEFVKKTSRESLKILGTVGEPINPEAWKWYFDVPGNGNCPIVDTWWQTETGGILISPQTGAIELKPVSATLPFYGIIPVIVDKNGNELDGEC